MLFPFQAALDSGRSLTVWGGALRLSRNGWICPQRPFPSPSLTSPLPQSDYGVCVSPAVCVRRRVPRLVYTSTVNVTFGGKPIDQGDEDSVPYFPLDKVPISGRDGAGWQAWE